MQKTESGKDEIEALKDQVSALEKQLKEVHEEDSKKLESMAVDKDQIEQLNARVAVLDSEGEVLKAQLLKAFADVKEMQQKTLDRQAENSALIVFYQVIKNKDLLTLKTVRPNILLSLHAWLHLKCRKY